MRSLAALLLLLVVSAAGAQTPSVPTTVTVTVDSVRRQVVITAGPFDLANSPSMPGMSHGMMHMAETPMMRFEWPVDGSLRGVDLTLHDTKGKPLPTKILHHLAMYNFDRRGLIHPSVERLFAWGQDTRTILLPSGVGVPLPVGEHLGFLIGWHNDTGHDIHDAYLRMTLPFAAPKTIKASVLPWYLDVHMTYGTAGNSFDIPAGRSTQRFDFQVPVSGRLIAVGGHMHDYGLWVSLVDSVTGKTLIKLRAVRDKQGNVTGTERFVYGFNADALPIQANHTYTLVSAYENPTGKALVEGGMGQLNGVFEPSDMALWPKIDFNDARTMADLKSLPPDLGSDEAGAMHDDGHDHEHMDMEMPGDSVVRKDSVAGKPRRR